MHSAGPHSPMNQAGHNAATAASVPIINLNDFDDLLFFCAAGSRMVAGFFALAAMTAMATMTAMAAAGCCRSR